MKLSYLLIPIAIFLMTCCSTENDDLSKNKEHFYWDENGEFIQLNKFQIYSNTEFGRYSEGAFVKIDQNTILAVYTRFEGDHFDETSAKLVSRKSYDKGLTWSDEKIIVHNSDNILNVMSASLIKLDNGNIGLIYLIKESIVNCYPVVCLSSDNGESFGDPKPIIESGNGYYTLVNSRVSKLSSGRIIVPISEFENDGIQLISYKGRIFFMYSDDDGYTWEKSEYFKPCDADVTEQEPGIIELKDRSLLAWVRTNKGFQYFSRSYDNGNTWSDFSESSLISPLSPACIVQTDVGKKPLIAVWNNSISERKPLVIALSYDNGYTWQNNYTINDYSYSSYPAIFTLDDGEILIQYSYSDTFEYGFQNYSIEKYQYFQNGI